MDAALNKKSLACGIPGIILQIAGRFFPLIESGNRAPSTAVLAVAVGMLLVGTILLIAGLSWYAKAKGQSHWWGLMGFLSIIGLIVLACLPDRGRA